MLLQSSRIGGWSAGHTIHKDAEDPVRTPSHPWIQRGSPGDGERLQPWLGRHTGGNSEGKMRITALLPSLRFSECFFF